MDYDDFELEIGVGTGREYPLTVLHSTAGEARETMRFPFDELALENRLLTLQNALLRSGGSYRTILSPEEQTVQDFGRDLYQALLTGEVRSRYAVSRQIAEDKGNGLRLKLRFQAPELAALPWEFLYDPGQNEYVCLSSNTPIVRYIEFPKPPRPLSITPPLRILGMIASPTDLMPLDVDRERQRIEKALEGLIDKGLVSLTWLDGQSWRDLQRTMRSGPWHIFHFIGHGGFDRQSGEGLIVLSGDEGQAQFLRATELGRLLADHYSLRLVLLNACESAQGSKTDIFSSTAAILVGRGLPAVMAMQYEITDRAAIEFARAFYEAMADGLAVDTSVAEARKAVSLGVVNTLEWGTPVLYMRSPDGMLFDIQAHSQEDLRSVNKAEEEPIAREKVDVERVQQERTEADQLTKEKDEIERLVKAYISQQKADGKDDDEPLWPWQEEPVISTEEDTLPRKTEKVQSAIEKPLEEYHVEKSRDEHNGEKPISEHRVVMPKQEVNKNQLEPRAETNIRPHVKLIAAVIVIGIFLFQWFASFFVMLGILWGVLSMVGHSSFNVMTVYVIAIWFLSYVQSILMRQYGFKYARWWTVGNTLIIGTSVVLSFLYESEGFVVLFELCVNICGGPLLLLLQHMLRKRKS